jgi:tetratricopeptide (TPR) repeat protein
VTRGTASPAARLPGALLAALVLGALALQAAACFGPWRPALWGLHLLAFLPAPFRAVTWMLELAVAACLLAPRRFGGVDRALARFDHVSPRVLVPALAGLAAALFWILRSRQTVLGDAWPLVTELPHGVHFHPRQPLSMWLQQVFFRGLGGGAGNGSDPVAAAMRSVAVGGCVAGLLFVPVAWGLGSVLGTTRAVALLGCCLLLSQGYMLLFYGYLENYAFYALCIGLFVLCGLLTVRGRVPLLVPLAVVLLAVGLHLSAIALLPGALFLVGLGLARPASRRRAARDVVLAGVGIVGLDRSFAALSPGFSLWQAVRGILGTAASDQGGGAGVAYFFSGRHFRDFLNEQYLIGPLSAFLFLSGLALWVAGRVRPGIDRVVPAAIRADAAESTAPAAAYIHGTVFLALVAGTYLAASASVSDPALGYARDWDLFAPAGIAFAAAGLQLWMRFVRDDATRRRILACGIIFSSLHLGAWVWTNHSEAVAMSRFATLPLGQGRTEVVIGNWHLRHGRSAEAEAWFEKALAVNSNNSNAWELLGQVRADREDLVRATEAFVRAAALRPDKPLFLHNAVIGLEKLGRWEEALHYYEPLCRLEPEYVPNWLGFAHALQQLGRDAAARQVLERFLQLYPDHPERDRVRAALAQLPSVH